MTHPATASRRPVRALVVALLAVLAGLGAAPAALANPPAPPPAAGAPAYLRLAHLSPDTPPVDVYVDSAADPSRSFVVPGVGYGAVSDYRPLPPDSYVISMRAAGAPASAPPVISTSLDARPGAAYTVAGTGRSADLGLSVLDDELDMPPAGRASVRVINAALSAPSADIGPVNGPVWAQDVAFGTETAYVDCPLGTWDLRVTAGAASETVPLTLEQNSSYTVLLVDRGNGLEPQVTRDSTGAGTVPTGGVDAGLGGAARPSPLPPYGAALLVAVLVAVLGGATVRRRSGGR
jgi:hypothetical protein